MYVNELINNYTEEKVITYKGERYSVRDNGAIKRHALMPEMPRPLDEIWTFGKKDNKTGYMMYGGHRVHIIVANAFMENVIQNNTLSTISIQIDATIELKIYVGLLNWKML